MFEVGSLRADMGNPGIYYNRRSGTAVLVQNEDSIDLPKFRRR